MDKCIFFSNLTQEITVGVNSIVLSCFTCFSFIYFSDIPINAKYKLPYHKGMKQTAL